MRGITEKRFEIIGKKIGLTRFEIAALIKECTELTPWLPIADAPWDRELLYFYPSTGSETKMISSEEPGCRAVDFRRATHYQELPEDPT